MFFPECFQRLHNYMVARKSISRTASIDDWHKYECNVLYMH